MRCLAVTIALVAILQLTQLRAQQRACEVAQKPKELPPVGALVDSASAVTALGTIDAPEGMLFSLVLREGDSIPLVRPLFGTDSTAAGIVVSAIRPQKRADESWAVRLLAVGGPALVLRIERASYCPPVFISRSQGTSTSIVTVRTSITPDRALRTASRPVPIYVRALISEEGEPLRVTLKGSSGIPELDEQLAASFRDQRFEPARLDGLAVQAWYQSDQAQPKPAEPRPALPPSDDDSVFLESEVDERPEFITHPPLRYPDAIREAGVQGRVVIEAIIDKQGHVEKESIRVIESPHPDLTRPATNMVRQSKFRPGSLRGRSVRVRVKFPIDFTIED